jgi:dTDP-4-amino-4,6-dideoxygalactose transaminase
LKNCRSPVRVQRQTDYQTRHIYNQFVICCERRDALRAYLSQAGIGTEIYYPVPLHLQRCFSYLGYGAGDFPVSERIAAESLALPVYPGLSEEQIAFVVESISRFFKDSRG